MLRNLATRVRPWIHALPSLILLCPAPCLGVDKDAIEKPTKRPLIEGYEPNYLGYTWQDDDVSFIDIGISLKYPLLPDHFALWRGCKRVDEDDDGSDVDPACAERWRAYLTFTGRSGFYAFSRDSGPVIAKTFNPKLLLRYTPNTEEKKAFQTTTRGEQEEYVSYVDLAYAHESNGQSIDSPEEYFAERRQSSDRRFALDKVSRG